MAVILVCGVKVPFTRGGADALVHSLIKELRARGHEADSVELPYTPLPKEGLLNQAAQWRMLDLSSFSGKKVDLVIATKFPSYFVRHPAKSVWLVHQHRAIYELYGTRFSDFSDDPRDEELRRLLCEGDNQTLGEARYVSGISRNVCDRLAHYNGIQSEVLYPPLPLGAAYCSKPEEDFILCVGRICSIKRIDLMIKALPIVHQHVKLKIAGIADEPGIMDYLTNEIAKHHLSHRVEFLGRVDDATLVDHYARCRAVYYAPFNEDYGYVTLEAFACGKPVVTGVDSGGTLEFVEHERNGLIVEPTTDAIGHAMNHLIENPDVARAMGQAGSAFIQRAGLMEGGWDKVVAGLLSPLAV